MRGNGKSSLEHPKRNNRYRRRPRFNDEKHGQQDKAHDKRPNNPRTPPRQLIAPQTQAHQLHRDAEDEEQRAGEVDALPHGAEATPEGDAARLVLYGEDADDESDDVERDLQEEAPAPADLVGDGAARGCAEDGAEAPDAVLHGLVHASPAKGDHVRVDDCCCPSVSVSLSRARWHRDGKKRKKAYPSSGDLLHQAQTAPSYNST